MSSNKRQRRVSRPVAEVVGSVAGVSLPRDGSEIKLVLEMVILRRVARGLIRENSAKWLDAVLAKLVSVGVTTLRELVMAAPTLNQRLYDANRPKLHDLTISEMMAEVVLMIQWPVMWRSLLELMLIHRKIGKKVL